MSESRKIPMVHTNVRLPVEVVRYFQRSPGYTKQIRKVLEDYVEQAQKENASTT
jgi:hypothetical protein